MQDVMLLLPVMMGAISALVLAKATSRPASIRLHRSGRRPRR
jgi:hypothetical protein